jgi:hypothetical protein
MLLYRLFSLLLLYKMVFLWLERHNLLTLKSYLNGKTRSFSLLGNSVAAIAGIFFALYLEADQTIFLCSIPAYVLDFLCVASYPSYMNTTATTNKNKNKKKKTRGKSGGFCADMKSLATVMKNPGPRRVVLTTAATGVFHRVFKDFIQPVVMQNGEAFANTFQLQSSSVPLHNTTIMTPSSSPSSPASSLTEHNTAAAARSVPETTQIVVLGIAYCVFYLVSSPASQNAYRIPKLKWCGGRWSEKQEKKVMDSVLDGYACSLLVIAIALYCAAPILAPIIYVLLYVLYNISKPLSASAVSDVAGKRLRATVFSADAALQTLLTAGLAPLAGVMADNVSLAAMFLTFACALVVLNRVCIAEVSVLNTRSSGRGLGLGESREGDVGERADAVVMVEKGKT